jgi:hypothetical protein
MRCRRGLFEARTIRFPSSFLNIGRLRAFGRIAEDIVPTVLIDQGMEIKSKN